MMLSKKIIIILYLSSVWGSWAEDDEPFLSPPVSRRKGVSETVESSMGPIPQFPQLDGPRSSLEDRYGPPPVQVGDSLLRPVPQQAAGKSRAKRKHPPKDAATNESATKKGPGRRSSNVILDPASIGGEVSQLPAPEMAAAAAVTEPVDPDTSAHSLFDSLRGPIGSMMRRQFKVDESNQQFVPRLTLADSEPVGGRIRGTLQLTRRIYRGHQSTVFEAAKGSSLFGVVPYLIKYEWNCDPISRGIHPLIVEKKFGREIAEKTGLAPRPIFLSAPRTYSGELTPKTEFQMPQSFKDKCVEGGRSNLRFLVVEKINGVTIGQLRRSSSTNGILTLKVVFSLAVFAIEGLANIHDLNIVHGDIHRGNIMLEYGEGKKFDIHKDPETGKIQGLKFIDFGRSFTYEPDLPSTPVHRRFRYYHHMYTHWQIEGYAWSKRDDLYKLIHMIAMLMNDQREYVDFENSLMAQFDSKTGIVIEGSVDRLISWKRDDFIFRIPGSDPLASLPDQRAIRENLSEVLNLVRAVEINGDIPYQRIMKLFVDCVRLL